MRGKRKLIAAAVVALGLAAGGLSAPAFADIRSGTLPWLNPATVRGSVHYLRTTFGVSEDEAMRRLRLQQWAETQAARLESQAAATYAGMRLDQQHGGRLVVMSTSVGSVKTLLRAAPDRKHIVVERVSRSLAQLRATRQRLASQLGAGPDSLLLPEVSEDTNQVVVWKGDWLVAEWVQKFAAQQRTALDRAVAESAGGVVVRSLAKPRPLAAIDLGYCHPLACTDHGPMRGGLRLDISRDDGTVGGCTSGFNVRAHGGAYAGQAFVLTGGHCVVGGRHTHADTPAHNGEQVLREDNGLELNAYPLDFALMPYANAATANRWLESQSQRNLVLSFCQEGGRDAECTHGDIPITNVRTFERIATGWVVCASGAGASSADYPGTVDTGAGPGYRPGAHCGRILEKVGGGGINTDVCARAGDSGGPLFSEVGRAAYGILEGNLQEREGACQPDELNNYASVSTILSHVNSQATAQGSTFKVITTAGG